MVLFTWYKTAAQRQLAESSEGFSYIRLGRRAAPSTCIQISLECGIFCSARVAGSSRQVCSFCANLVFGVQRDQLRDVIRQHARGPGVSTWESDVAGENEDNIYALFRCRPDPRFAGQDWHGEKVMNLIEAFETDARNRLVENIRRKSAYPRILPLRDLLKTRR